MSSKKMLIDATHPEETRVVVLADSKLEDFEVEAADRKQLKGNIYLAKVTRVEPSLQAAFVDYGGNRHGFLAFSEIHPDYYQIPVSDREKLIAEQEAAEKAAAEAEEAEAEADAPKAKRGGRNKAADADGEAALETIEGDEGEEIEVRRPSPSFRNYKIQEVIKRRQILLVQVVKEERGTKGAALTTYLSLAGRYCVLMPNTARGGGISRKIGSGKDRTRLKGILKELEIPDGMAVIVRTAGAQRSKTEIKRDCTYLLRLWESVRELTLSSIAPALVYEEANLIKRTIRDLYANDVEEISVAGDEGFQTARTFMRLLMPSHAKRVKQHPPEAVPLFIEHNVEKQLKGIYDAEVSLRSGGYIVINPTEALVSIDVNSGRSTRERNIEETALKTNLEASDEIARQLRLREMAGLIVIDFIDMDNTRNQAQVERRLKGAMRNDRARIQIGRISPFGLMELSRQRLHPSLFETSFEAVPHSSGVGYRRTVASAALAALRVMEEEAQQGKAQELQVNVPTAVALYILNFKRSFLAGIETRHDVVITFRPDDTLTPPNLRIDRLLAREAVAADSELETAATGEEASDDETAGDGTKRRRRRRRRGRRPEEDDDNTLNAAEDGDSQADDDEPDAQDDSDDDTAEASDGDDDDGRSRRRRRGRRGGRRRNRGDSAEQEASEDGDAEDQETQSESAPEQAADADSAGTEDEPATKRPRRRRRRTRQSEESRAEETGSETASSDETEPELALAPDAATQDHTGPANGSGNGNGSGNAAALPSHRDDEPEAADETADETADEPEDLPAPSNAADAESDDDDAESDDSQTVVQVPSPAGGGGEDTDQSPRRGWWQRIIR